VSNLTVTKEKVEEILAGSSLDIVKLGDKTTVVAATLPNGFVVVASSSCVDPENYDENIGVSICKKRIIDKIWELEGYVLQSMVGAN
jgi:hypothetical protein